MAGTNKRFYKAKAKQWALAESSTGKEQVAVLFEILTPDAAEKHLTWYGFFTEATADRTIESLRYCGWQGDDLLDLTGLDTNEVELVVEDEEYEGKINVRVQWINRVAALSLKVPLTGDKAKAFAAAMKGKIRALDAAGGKRTPSKPASSSAPAGPPEPPPLTDADIPF